MLTHGLHTLKKSLFRPKTRIKAYISKNLVHLGLKEAILGGTPK